MSSELGMMLVRAIAKPIARSIEKGSTGKVLLGALAGGILGALAGLVLMQFLDKEWWWYLLLPGGGTGAILGAVVGSFLGSQDGSQQQEVHGKAPASITTEASGELSATENGPVRASQKDQGEDSASTTQGTWKWITAVLSAFGVLIGTVAKCQKDSRELRPQSPQMSEEEKKKISEDFRQIQELDPLVVYTRQIPKPGEPDLIEMQLQNRLTTLRKKDADDRQIKRLEKSLDYWQERKRRAHAKSDGPGNP